MKPRLSIIVPVYNVEQYLRKCVDSILNQTFKEFELILVDDGSTDGSSRICDDYKEKNDRICVLHKENGGLSDARNYGIDHSNGEYIAFVDSDDWIDNDMYESMMKPIIDYDADIVVCGHRVVTVDGQIEETVVFDKPILLTGVEATIEILKDERMPSFAWNKLYKKSLFKDIRFPKGMIYEDLAVVYRYFDMAKRVYVLNKVYYNYLRRPGSLCLSQTNEKAVKRIHDNAQAFYERYVFAKNNMRYESVLPICAQKCMTQLRNFIHYCAKYRFLYGAHDLQHAFEMYSKMDVRDTQTNSFRISIERCLFRISRKFYYFLLRLYYLFTI